MYPQNAPSWIWSPVLGARWSTMVTMAAILAVVGWRTRNPLRAIVAGMAWLCGYEIIYEATGSAMHGWSLTTLMWTTTGTAGWLLAYWALGMRPRWWLLGIFGILWIAWMLTGYHSNWQSFLLGQPGADARFSYSDEAWNVVTKTILALALMFGRLRAQLDDDEVERLGDVRGAARADADLQLHGVGAGHNAG